MVDWIVEQVDALDPGPIVLVGHSLGSAMAVRTAQRRPGRITALLSMEGNLTTADGYFSASAADHGEASSFIDSLLERVADLVAEGAAPASYLESIRNADPVTLWSLGLDSAFQGLNDAFGTEFLALGLPARYLWSARSTPLATQRYLLEHGIDHRRNDQAGHWPLEHAQAWVLDEIRAFLDECAITID
jgi:pimeloyl-ACP methyl ester carboxylesterase